MKSFELDMKRKNLIIILIDGVRLDRALQSEVFKRLASKSISFPQTITYACTAELVYGA